MGQAIAHANSPMDAEHLWWKANKHLWKQERMERIGGFICYSAPAPVLRLQARMIQGLRVRQGNWATEMAYHFLASSSETSCYADGEVQILADYVERVGAATEARRALVENPKQAVICETMQEAISRERDHIKSGRKFRNRRRTGRRQTFSEPMTFDHEQPVLIRMIEVTPSLHCRRTSHLAARFADRLAEIVANPST